MNDLKDNVKICRILFEVSKIQVLVMIYERWSTKKEKVWHQKKLMNITRISRVPIKWK